MYLEMRSCAKSRLGSFLKDTAMGWGDFMQQVAITVKVKELRKKCLGLTLLRNRKALMAETHTWFGTRSTGRVVYDVLYISRAQA